MKSELNNNHYETELFNDSDTHAELSKSKFCYCLWYIISVAFVWQKQNTLQGLLYLSYKQ